MKGDGMLNIGKKYFFISNDQQDKLAVKNHDTKEISAKE